MLCRSQSAGSTAALTLLGVLLASPGYAQAPPSGPLVLHVPPSARVAALGNAWVAGRDQDVVFFNPAQLIGARPGFDVSVTRLGPASTMGSIGSVFAAGKWSLTLGWGAQVLGFRAGAGAPYPFSPDILLARGSGNGTSALLAAGAAIVIKGFRIGASGKFVSDTAAASRTPAVHHHALLADVGIARNLFGGAAALSVQNLARGSIDGASRRSIPRQVLVGWSAQRQAGPFDVGLFSQVTMRHGWTAPAAGLEVGYSWIEGYTVVVRAGARRAESVAEQPVSLGAAFTIDRLTVEYAVRFFDGGRSANGVTIRWR